MVKFCSIQIERKVCSVISIGACSQIGLIDQCQLDILVSNVFTAAGIIQCRPAASIDKALIPRPTRSCIQVHIIQMQVGRPVFMEVQLITTQHTAAVIEKIVTDSMVIVIHLHHDTDGGAGIAAVILIGSDFASQRSVIDGINILILTGQVKSVALPASLGEVTKFVALRLFFFSVLIRLSNGCQVGPVCRIRVEAASRIVQGIQPQYHGIILYIVSSGYLCLILSVCKTAICSRSCIQLKGSFLLRNDSRIGDASC